MKDTLTLDWNPVPAFSLLLPQQDCAARQQKSGSLRNRRVLVIETDSDGERQLAPLLSEAGYEVFQASCGIEGLRVFNQQHPHLVVAPAQLADLERDDFLRHVQAGPVEGARGSSVILVFDEFPNIQEELFGLLGQADDFLVKPLTPEEVRARVWLTLNRRRNREALAAAHQHFRQLINIFGEAVLMVNLQGQVLWGNAQAVSLLGYVDEAELMGRGVFALVQGGEREVFRGLLAATVAMEIRRDQHFTLVRKGGQSFTAELHCGWLAGWQDCAPILALVLREVSPTKTAG